MAKRKYSKPRTSKRRTHKRRTHKRKYRRSSSRSKRRTSRKKRASPRARGNYTRPCPPGFTRGPTGHCRGSKYDAPEYKMPTFDYGLKQGKTGSELRFKSPGFGQKSNLADILAARRAASGGLESTGTGTGLLTKFLGKQEFTRPTWKEDTGEGPFKLGRVLGGRRRFSRRH